MLFHDDPQELLIELAADINEIGNEMIWAFYTESAEGKIYTDYRYKENQDQPLPSVSGAEKVEDIEAKTLLTLLKKQNHL